MKTLSTIRSLRLLQTRDNEGGTVVRLQLRRFLRLQAENLNAGECVTVGMVLLAQGIAAESHGSMARAYALSAMEGLREELAEQVRREAAIARVLDEARAEFDK